MSWVCVLCAKNAVQVRIDHINQENACGFVSQRTIDIIYRIGATIPIITATIQNISCIQKCIDKNQLMIHK